MEWIPGAKVSVTFSGEATGRHSLLSLITGSKGSTGAAAGLLGPPPRTMATFCSNIGRLTATGRVADAPLGSWTGRSGFVCRIRLPGLMVPCAGQPTMVEARRKTSAQGIRGRCSRGEDMCRYQWPAGSGSYHGPAGGGMSHFDYRTRTAVDQSERNPGHRNAGNDERATGVNHCRT